MHPAETETRTLLRRRTPAKSPSPATHRQSKHRPPTIAKSRSMGWLMNFRSQTPDVNWKSGSFSESRSSRHSSRATTPRPKRATTPTTTPRQKVPDGVHYTPKKKNYELPVVGSQSNLRAAAAGENSSLTSMITGLTLWGSSAAGRIRSRNERTSHAQGVAHTDLGHSMTTTTSGMLMRSSGSTTSISSNDSWTTRDREREREEKQPFLGDDVDVKSDYLDDVVWPREVTPRPFGDRERTPSELDIIPQLPTILSEEQVPPNVKPRGLERSRGSRPMEEYQLEYFHADDENDEWGQTATRNEHKIRTRRQRRRHSQLHNDLVSWILFVMEICLTLIYYSLCLIFRLIRWSVPVLAWMSTNIPTICHIGCEVFGFVWEVLLSIVGFHSWRERPSWTERAPDLYETSAAKHDMFVLEDENSLNPLRSSRRILRRDRRLIETRAGKCLICLTRSKNMALQDCGHVVSCHMCAQSLSQCPVCRVLIKLRPLYLRF